MQRKASGEKNCAFFAVGEQRRKEPRSDEQLFGVCLGYGTAGSAVELITKNISSGGLAVDLPFAVSVGARLWLEVYVPADAQGAVMESVYVKGCVVWQQALAGENGSNRCRVGVAFEELPAQVQEKIARHVETECVMS